MGSKLALFNTAGTALPWFTLESQQEGVFGNAASVSAHCKPAGESVVLIQTGGNQVFLLADISPCPVCSCFSWKCCALEVILHKPWLGRSELSNCNLSPFSLFLYGETIFVRIRSVKFFFASFSSNLIFFFPNVFQQVLLSKRCLLWTDTSPWV